MKHIMFECEQLVNEKIAEKMVEKLALEEAYKTEVDCLENDIKRLKGEILQLKTEHNDAIFNQKLEQEKEKQALHQYYQKEINLIKNEKVIEIKKIGLELDLQRRQAIEEIEKQKDCHMKQLIQAHENLTEKMKNYYNDIIKNDILLIKSLKAQITSVLEKESHLKEKVKNLKTQNEGLNEELCKMQQSVQKHEENINKNIHVGSVVRNLQREIKKLKPENDILYSKLMKVECAKKDLEMKCECLSKGTLVNRDLVQKKMISKQSIHKRNKINNIKVLASTSSENNEYCPDEVEDICQTITAIFH
ncbi:dynein regulatory complex subunit 4-like isoform X2 [Stegodyphus dumicola]|uniref:dynein regulatory complex subunit 4-like isoform X2 n=1 Tax=Stegodyphus dumicola TaxID=202533 RepID=UPI0015AC2B9C|nr:dynein regulatory complex subunit 4-like isoform X2 [Stegodyphus dumicola]